MPPEPASLSRVRRPLLALLLALLAPVARAQTVKLSGPLAQPVGGSVKNAQLSPDGARVVYVADQDTYQ